MNACLGRAVILALVAAPAAALSPETLSRDAAGAFAAALARPASVRPCIDLPAPPSLPGGGSIQTAEPVEPVGPAPTVPAARVDLAPLLNRYLREGVRRRIGGRGVVFSASYDSQRREYLTVLAEGLPAAFVPRGSLMREEGVPLDLGGTAYNLRALVNIFDIPSSVVRMARVSDPAESVEFRARELAEEVFTRGGERVELSDHFYKLYSGDSPDGSGRLLVFIYGTEREQHVFLVPHAAVPTDRVGAFSMWRQRRVGLLNRGGVLEVYEYPERRQD